MSKKKPAKKKRKIKLAPRPRGRPRLLEQDPKLMPMICKYLREGMTPKQAADHCCITRRSIDNWLAEGAEDIERGIASEKAEFFLRVKRAIAIFFRGCTKSLLSAGPGWQKYAWVLERRDGEDYARPTHVELTGKGGAAVHVEQSHRDPRELNDREIAAEIAALRERQRQAQAS